MEVGQRVAVGRDDHARAAALAVGRKHGQHAVLGLVDHGDAPGLGARARPASALRHGAARSPSAAKRSAELAAQTAISFAEPRVAQQEVIARTQSLSAKSTTIVSRRTPASRDRSARGASPPVNDGVEQHPVVAANRPAAPCRSGRTASSMPAMAWKSAESARASDRRSRCGCAMPGPCDTSTPPSCSGPASKPRSYRGA